jgi:UDP-3-O-[3-hydroxymyristoyl] glucosamine N-acyltransferase
VRIKIGKHCIIHNGVVIGADGFGYLTSLDKTTELKIEKLVHCGSVMIEDFVEIGANTCIDRATYGITKIGKDTKIDNLVQIGHNVKIGEHTLICGQVGLAGSSKIGDRVVLAGKVGVTDHVEIGDDIRVGAAAVVTSKIDQAGDYMGQPARRAHKWRRQMKTLEEVTKERSKYNKD